MVNVTPVVFHAISVTISVYVQFDIMVVLLLKAVQFKVAVTHELLSAKVRVISVLYVLPLVAHEYVGGILSIRDTVSISDNCVRVFHEENHAHVV